MKLLSMILLLGLDCRCQVNSKLQLPNASHWKMDHTKWLTGGLVFIAGASKGFNETLQFHWPRFQHKFPRANAWWFNPKQSWKNKYKNRDSSQGPSFFLSKSVLIMCTDQYHLNNFINRGAWVTAIVLKIGEGKKSFKQYLFDFLYYSICHQLGFSITYYPFVKLLGK